MKKIIGCDFGSTANLQSEVLGLLEESLSAETARPFAVMLSGGSTPLPVYEALAEHPVAISPQLHVTFTDDRHVPRDSPDSNYGNTLPMLQALGVPSERIIGVNTDLSLEESAAAFEADLDAFFARGGRLSLALLGLGGDTHTCSLFSAENLHAAEGHRAVAVTRPEPPHRVSVTPSVLQKAERVIFLVAGPSKASVIAQMLEHPETTIAGQATAGCTNVELWYAVQ